MPARPAQPRALEDPPRAASQRCRAEPHASNEPSAPMTRENVDATHVLGSAAGAAFVARRCHLVVLEGPRLGERFALDRPRLQFGKGPDNDVVLPDPSVSRTHFEIVEDNGGFLVRDLGSTNGTFLEGAQVREAYLRPGLRLKAGECSLLVELTLERVAVEPGAVERFGTLVGKSPPMRSLFAMLERIAPTDLTVLVVGETGCGKGATARAIHENSPRAKQPFVVVDCAAVARTLIEAELFGNEKGAFTGAFEARAGACERADGGTLFLDEVDDLPLDLQPKLLRVLEERVVQRLGSGRTRRLDLRVIAATKADPSALVGAGKMREDLYFRVAVMTVPIPPLRARVADLPLLVASFLGGDESAWDRMPADQRAELEAHPWPGNVRELRNFVERLRHLGAGAFPPDTLGNLEAARPSFSPARSAPPGPAEVDIERPFKEVKEELVERFERQYLERLLERSGWNIAKAARDAKLDRKYFYDLLRKHGLERQGTPGRGEPGKEPT
ncbi:MAG: sigma 54-dependent Fis family transcriptional regulator [Deltaproteobacteria bacterium]|nr:sigma 54-dependent Fis family transcriptional regulator [Deltaproteobacteria bacterium]